jgi:predicted nucleotidyltransferase
MITTTGQIKSRQDFEPVILELNARLKKKYNDFVGITFFGSRYNGNFSDDSDFDIVILFSEKPGWQKEREVMGVVLEKEIEYNIVIDAKVYHEAEIKKQNTPFRMTISSQGAHYGA